MKDADYIYAVASIRVKEKNLLTDADIQTMIGMKSEKEVLSFLKERGWGDSSSDSSMEELLSAAQEAEMKQLVSLGLNKEVIDTLATKGALPPKYNPHILSGKWSGVWECHIQPDWLLLWKQNDSILELVLVATGTHSDLF